MGVLISSIMVTVIVISPVVIVSIFVRSIKGSIIVTCITDMVLRYAYLGSTREPGFGSLGFRLQIMMQSALRNDRMF